MDILLCDKNGMSGEGLKEAKRRKKHPQKKAGSLSLRVLHVSRSSNKIDITINHIPKYVNNKTYVRKFYSAQTKKVHKQK